MKTRMLWRFFLQAWRSRKEPLAILGLLATGGLSVLIALQDPDFDFSKSDIDIFEELPWWLPPDIVYV